ncbi:MAG: AGE family epimerase/isomerase [Candidatus Latescibacterota bacterium]
MGKLEHCERPFGMEYLANGGIVSIAGMKPEKLRDRFQSELYNEYLPFLEKYVIDDEYGGFLCHATPEGVQVNAEKRAWYEGRGIWIFSYLHNKMGGDPRHLEIAAKSAEFTLRLKPAGDAFFPASFTREGKPLTEGEIYGDLFIALGLQELAKAPGMERRREEAKSILLKCLRIYDRPDYPGKPFRPELPDITAPRMLGHWMIMVRTASQMLEAGPDPEIGNVVDRCVDAIMNRHYNPRFGLVNEVLNHDFSRPDNEYERWSYLGHALEVHWFMLDEALRRKDQALFDTAAERFARHLEAAWDPVYGGVLRSLNDVEQHTWMLDKILLFHCEILIGLMMLVEHTGSRWSREWYGRAYHYGRKVFDARAHGYNPWRTVPDRVGLPQPKDERIDNYHYPQHLMLNLQALDRIIARQGGISHHFG